MEKNNNVKRKKREIPRPTKNFTTCKLCDANHANKSKSKQHDKISKASNHKVHKRQTILSEYFPKQEVPKSGDVMVNFRKLVGQLLNARVIVEKLSLASAKAKLCPSLHINVERLQMQPKPSEDDDCVLRYCRNCKTSHYDRVSTTARKKCGECATNLLYACDRCDGTVFKRYRCLRRHWKSCDGGKRDGKSMESYYCSDCEFFTAYEARVRMHVARTRHRVVRHSNED